MSIMNRGGRSNRDQAVVAHRQTLTQNLQRRVEAARAKGDDNLVAKLKAEAKYLNIDV